MPDPANLMMYACGHSLLNNDPAVHMTFSEKCSSCAFTSGSFLSGQALRSGTCARSSRKLRKRQGAHIDSPPARKSYPSCAVLNSSRRLLSDTLRERCRSGAAKTWSQRQITIEISRVAALNIQAFSLWYYRPVSPIQCKRWVEGRHGRRGQRARAPFFASNVFEILAGLCSRRCCAAAAPQLDGAVLRVC